MKRFYVGCRAGAPYEVFKADAEPTEKTHGHLYAAVIGPFDTKRGAEFMAKYGNGNPHCRCVADAERLAKDYEYGKLINKSHERLASGTHDNLL